MTHDDPTKWPPRPPMPSILDYRSPEEYSEALKAAGFLDDRTEGVLTDSEGVLCRAHYRNGQLEFDDASLTLSSLYEQRRTLRADAADQLRDLIEPCSGQEKNHGAV